MAGDIFSKRWRMSQDRELRYQHGTGPSNVFILDTSSSLGEEGFTQMKEAFISIINGQSHIVGEFHIRQRIILISDGRPTDFTSTSHTNDDDAAAAATAGFDETMLEFISVQSQGGKIVHRHEARQFAKYSQHITIASRLSYSMMNDGNDRERVMTSLVCRFPDEEFSEMDQDAIYEICSKKSLYGSLDRSKLNRDEDEDAFEERNPNMPRLGSRVRRGRDWKWHDQDNFGLGTVIGHCKKGPDWEWENQDGGAGSIGSVVTVVNNCIVLKLNNNDLNS
uniref:Uncharacterized protein n=1 Tax=Magallana gigas TaxID=29159 RepID=K1RND5_MAGGI